MYLASCEIGVERRILDPYLFSLPMLYTNFTGIIPYLTWFSRSVINYAGGIHSYGIQHIQIHSVVQCFSEVLLPNIHKLHAEKME